MTDICDFSELPKYACGDKCCRPDLTPRPQPRATEVLSVTAARFDSKCPACGDPIREGDMIGRTSAGVYICEGCRA